MTRQFAIPKLAALLFLTSPCLLPQTTQTPADKAAPEIASHDTPTTFSTHVNLVMVPVVVRDRQGHAVGNLQKDDFLLFDKGKPQIISRFSIEKADSRSVPIEVPTDSAAEGLEKPAPATVIAAGRFVAYLFDDMHLAFGDLAQARNAAIKHLDESIQPSTRVAIYTTSGQNALDFTDDREKMRETMLRIMPRSRATPVGECPQISYYVADLIENKNDPMALNMEIADAISCGGASNRSMAEQLVRASASRMLSIGDADTQVTLAVMKDVIRRMSASPGDRHIVLVSPGFLVNLDRRQDEIEIIDRAIRANVTISSIDARGLYVGLLEADASQRGSSPQVLTEKSRYQRDSMMAEGETLADFSEGTGGIAFRNNNDLAEGFRRVTPSPEFIYILGFSPQNLKMDGSFHALKVTLKNKTPLTLQARRGYYSPKHLVDPAEEAKQEIREALFSREEMLEIPVQLQTQFFKTTEANAKLSIVARVDLRRLHFRKADGRNRNTLTIVSAVFDRNGNMVGAIEKRVEMKLLDETLEKHVSNGLSVKTSFDVTPGTYMIRLVLRDTEEQIMTARNGAVQIP